MSTDHGIKSRLFDLHRTYKDKVPRNETYIVVGLIWSESSVPDWWVEIALPYNFATYLVERDILEDLTRRDCHLDDDFNDVAFILVHAKWVDYGDEQTFMAMEPQEIWLIETEKLEDL